MILDLPKLGAVRFDDNLTPEQLNAELDRLAKKYDFELPQAEMGFGEMASKAFTRGTKRLGSTFGDIIPAMGAKALGFDEYAQKQLGEAAETEQEIAKYYAPQYSELSKVKGISDIPGFFLETIVEQIPNIATSLIPGIGAGAVAARTGLTSLGKSLMVQGAEKGLAGRELAEFVSKGMAQGAATRQAVGQGAGVFLGSYAQNAPEIFQNIYQETGQMDVGASLLFGVGSAALDSVLPAQLAKSLTGPVKVGIVEKVLEKSGMDKGILRSITAGALKGIGAEGLTEGAQEAISIYAENFVGNNPQIFDSADWNRIMESSLRGAVAGSAFGGAGGIGSRVQEKRVEFAEQQAKAAEQQRQELARQVQEAGLTIDEYNALQKQGMLPGMEMGAYTQLFKAKTKEQIKKELAETKQEAKKELTGKQLSLFDETGLPSKAAEAAKTKGDKAEANRLRQLQQQQAAELKASQDKLKKAIAEIAPAKPFNLAQLATGVTVPPGTSDLQRTISQAQADTEKLAKKRVAQPPTATPTQPPAEVTEQPFALPTGEVITEPTVVSKPVKLTPKEVATTIDDNVLGALGIGPTALIRKNKLIEGKDISNPADAAEVKRVLEAYADRKNLSTNIRQKVEEYLSRPEFTQEVISEPISEPAGPVGGPVQPSLPSDQQQPTFTSAPEFIEEPVAGGVATTRPAPVSVVGGEEAVSRPLGKKEAKDVAKAEEATPAILTRQEREIQRNDLQVLKMLDAQTLAAAEKEGLTAAEVSIDPEESTEAFKLLRLPFLFNNFFDLQDSINLPLNTPQGRAQRERNIEQLKLIDAAVAESGPEATQLLTNLATASANERARGISLLNKLGTDTHAEVVEAKIARAKALLETEGKKAEIKKDVTKQATEIGQRRLPVGTTTREDKFMMKMAGLPTDIKQAAERDDFVAFVEKIAGTEKDPDIKDILNKVKKLNLKTKIKIGTVKRKPGSMNVYDFGEYDPATNTITFDPDYLNRGTAIHEIVHAAISKILLNPSHPLTKELTKLYEGVYNQLGSSYGALDIHEFAAELISNPEFQATLKAIKAPRGGNMFQRMMQVLAEFFGFRKGTSAYDKGLRTISDIIDLSGDVEANNADKMFHGVGPSVNKAFQAVGQIGQSMPALAGRTVDQTKNFFSNIQDDGVLRAGMGLLRLDNLNTIYGKELPSIQTLLDALEKRNGQQEQEIKKINDNYKQFAAAVKADPKAAERMNNMAVDARLAQVDPTDKYFKHTPANIAEFRRLRSIFTGLPEELQNVYKDIRAAYDGALQRYEDLLLRSASPTLRNKLKLEFEARKKLVGYIPFLRRGDYYAEYADPKTGERAVQAFESVRERDNFIAKDLPANTKVRKYRNLHEARFVASEVLPTTFIGSVIKDLKAQGATDAMIDSIYQSYLVLMPAESISKRFMKSEDVLGMERDIVRGYGDTMIKWSRKLADSEYAPQIDNAITGIKNEAKAKGGNDLAAVSDTVNDQSTFFHNPTYGPIVSGLTTFSYFEYIAGNISSALINLTTLPMFAWPILGGKFGYNKTSSAMLAAGKVIVNGLDKNPKYKALYEALMDHGQLEHTVAREVLEARRMTTGDYLGIKGRFLDVLSIPFSATERYNRGVTAVAAFDLARAQGMSEADAIKYSVTTVKDINTSGMAATAPKYFQTSFGRVIFTFKSFVYNSAFIVARAFHQAYKGESPEVRRIAQKQLLGIYGMAGAFAGVKGLPFYGLAETMAQMLDALFGDDEPFNFDEEMRDFFGELTFKGPVNFLTNLEIANRTGVAQDLIFRDDPRGIAEHGYVLTAMKNAFGPTGSYLIGAERGIKAMNEGNVMRGIESLAPSWFRNGSKGLRYMTEGALTLKGNPIEEDIGAYNSLMQFIGFSPASLSSTYEKTSAATGYNREVTQRKQRLLNKYDMARTAGDSDLMAETREEIEAFNAKRTSPKDRITGDTLSKSQKARQAAEKNMINGVTFNRNRKAEIEEKFFSDEED